ncbi:MAG: ribbon-helix-helix domain-containing protein [Candidatus Bathyarchaeota archaeon]|nr:ribbon-helix-helix domain-containing protein [Candidatus Bathyarchaeota archaeon]
MSLEGFIEYKRREFCKDVKCPVQMKLNQQKEKTETYEKIRKTCSTACVYTTWQFHHWLIEKGYIIIASLNLKNKASLFTSIDQDLLKWIDKQVQSGKYQSRSHLIETILSEYKANKSK